MNRIKTYFSNLYHYALRHFPVTIIKTDNEAVTEWAVDVINEGDGILIDTADGGEVRVKFTDIKSLLITAR